MISIIIFFQVWSFTAEDPIVVGILAYCLFLVSLVMEFPICKWKNKTQIKYWLIAGLTLIIVVNSLTDDPIAENGTIYPVLYENGVSTNQVVVGTYKDYYLIAPYKRLKDKEGYYAELYPNYQLIEMNPEEKNKKDEPKYKTTIISYEEKIYEIRKEDIGPLFLP